MGFSLVTAFPEVCNIKCLCLKWGLKDFPNLMSEWWCDGIYCCNFSSFGIKEFFDFQYFILGPCTLKAPACNFNFKVPEALTVNFLCQKCGIQDFPDFRKEDFITQTFFCCHYEFGFKDIFNIFQLCCLKCETGIKVGLS